MSSETKVESLYALPPVATIEYPDIATAGPQRAGLRMPSGTARRKTTVDMTEEDLAGRIQREVAEAVQQTEQRLRAEYEAKLTAAKQPVDDAIAAFAAQRNEYFARVEAEVVQLALAIAGKILHRESQVDPMLVASLVRMTIDKMREGSRVTVRVATGQGKKWQEYFAKHSGSNRIGVAEDPELSSNDCVLETELGDAHFGLDRQLKEVEQGFFDLLALRPASR